MANSLSCTVWLIWLAFFGQVDCQNSHYDPVSSVMLDLLRDYDNYVPAEKPLILAYGISPVKVIDVDIENGLVTVDLWLKHHWTDSRLLWDPFDFNVSLLFMKQEMVYMPEMALYNGVMTPNLDPEVVVNSNGGITFFPAVRAEVYCQLPHLPFVNQICPIQIGPWSHDTRQILLNTFDPAVDHEFVINTGRCTIGISHANMTSSSYECCPHVFGTMTLYLNISCDGRAGSNVERLTGDIRDEAGDIRDEAGDIQEEASTSSFLLMIDPCFILLIFLLPPKVSDRVFLGTIVFLSLLLIWTSPVMPDDNESFMRMSAVVTIAATFASLVPCTMNRKLSENDVNGPKPSWIKCHLGRMIDIMMFAAVAVILGISMAGTFA